MKAKRKKKKNVATEMEGRGLTKGLSSLGGRDGRPWFSCLPFGRVNSDPEQERKSSKEVKTDRKVRKENTWAAGGEGGGTTWSVPRGLRGQRGWLEWGVWRRKSRLSNEPKWMNHICQIIKTGEGGGEVSPDTNVSMFSGLPSATQDFNWWQRHRSDCWRLLCQLIRVVKLFRLQEFVNLKERGKNWSGKVEKRLMIKQGKVFTLNVCFYPNEAVSFL